MRANRFAGVGVVLIAMGVLAGISPAGEAVRARTKPDKPWKEYAARTVGDLAGYRPVAEVPALDEYGGMAGGPGEKGTGFFRPRKIDGRWWLIDPLGNRFIHVAVVSVSPVRSPGARPAFERKFGTTRRWAEEATGQLWANGFNGAGGWSAGAELRAATRPVVYTQIWNLMSSFGKARGVTHQAPGHAGYVGDCVPIFHPDFEGHCDKVAMALERTKDDPWLLGHFSDNELPQPKLEKFLALPADNAEMASSRIHAEAWLAARHGGRAVGKAEVTAEDRAAFERHVWERYFEVTTRAIRKHDPNHLCLGSRLHGADKKSEAAWTAAGRFLDVVAVNYYGAWAPDPAEMARWEAWSGRPFMVTEFYTKGEDVAGLTNTTGAGWNVPTQRDRGLFYQTFCLGLIESRACVGWHWFKYLDNDPADTKADPSNRDSNKGIVNVRYEPYEAMLKEMRELNVNVHAVAQWMDARAGK